MRSPVERSMSSSRGCGCGDTRSASSSERVGRVAHRRDGRDDPEPALARVHEPPRDVPDLVRVGDGRAAELHDDGLRRGLGCLAHAADCRGPAGRLPPTSVRLGVGSARRRAYDPTASSGRTERGEKHLRGFTRKKSVLVALVAIAVVLVPTAAQADPSFYETPDLRDHDRPGSSLLVADAGQGIVNGDTGELVAALLAGVNDVAPIRRRALGAHGACGERTGQGVYRVSRRHARTMVANLGSSSRTTVNPAPGTRGLEPVRRRRCSGGKALVADAAGNSLSDHATSNSPSDVSSRVKVDASRTSSSRRRMRSAIFGCPPGRRTSAASRR